MINPWNLEALEELEAEFHHRVFTVLQLRLHSKVEALKKRIDSTTARERSDVELTYITRRGAWYSESWKGSEEKSGGVAMNIGVHFFDMLQWVFGAVENMEVHVRRPDTVSGVLELERARVRWFLSLNEEFLPESVRKAGKAAFRSLTLDGEKIDFSEGFTELHTRVYEAILRGNGLGIADARPSIQMVYNIRHDEIVTPHGNAHFLLSI